MSVFLILMVAGLTGLVLMALPGLLHQGHGGHAGHTLPPAGHTTSGHLPQGAGHHALPAPSGQQGAHAHATSQNAEGGGWSVARFLPNPRVIFSLMTLIGAFGNLFNRSLHLTPLLSGLLAFPCAYVIEQFAIKPLWNFLFQFEGKPSTPLAHLVLGEAEAVTPFANGKGIVQVVRDGRLVQFSAHLSPEQAMMPIHVGDKLRIEEVDAKKERLTVSLK